jgi:outer membrane protein OmpA-like peptidoglycan-associated protein
MKRILAILLMLLISTNLSFGQKRDLKLIDKEKYSNAEKKISEALLKKSDDIGLNYAMAVLLIKRKFTEYNPEKSYEYLMKAKNLFEILTDEKEQKSLAKIPINQTLFENYTDTVCKCALEDAIVINSIEIYEKFLSYYKTSPNVYKKKARENRDIVAFKTACDANTVESYQFFISKYTDAVQKGDAIKKRNAIEFGKAKAIDDIESYKEFIKKYPDAGEIGQTWERIHELAFAQAEKANTSISYKKFIDEYPKSKQYANAFKLFEEKQYLENKIDGNWNSLRSFIENYPNNSWKLVAQDSIQAIGLRTENLEILKYCLDHFVGSKRNETLLLYHNIFTNDGEKQTLDLFYNKYDNVILNDIKAKDYELADLGNKLLLNLPYNPKDYSKYDEYIRLAAPREKAFVAIQRMISPDINMKDWKSALTKANTYLSYFGTRNSKIMDLISILKSKWDNSIKINSVGSCINTVNGSEYNPVISADDKTLYFCGKDRKDNTGGEDIFVSKKINGYWSNAKIISDITVISTNQEPLRISNDGIRMLLFKSGKLYYSEKTSTGWSQINEFPKVINSGNWNGDAMISSDGKALLFASTRKGGFNIGTEDPLYPIYHGDSQHPSDIYVSTLNDNNEWSEPINLGNVINTMYCERMPFLHPDMKTLYFCSDGHGGLGKMDVFKSTRLSDTCWTRWSEPVNMGKEINTEESDLGYKITTDGEKAYFSKRNSAKENEDIYWLNLPKALRPDPVATVSGRLIDKNNHSVAAEIRWDDLETGKNVGLSKSDPTDGSFFIVLPLGKIYGYYVNDDKYFPASNNIDLRNNKPIQIEENINIVSLKQMTDDSTSVSLNNIFFNLTESIILPHSTSELKRVASIIKSLNVKIEISGHTDNTGDDNQNQILSEQRALAVKNFLVKEGCSTDKITFIGYGKTKPIASNDTDAGKAKNRRVELKCIK